ncbi:MAG: DUF1688 family protein [Microcoleaceae cyanobacterium MO_207.B10]|nr:DUF1688 family protein [Microcoleaceae cyanobacterium MO_207.B10]
MQLSLILSRFFSSNSDFPWQVDAKGLEQLDVQTLAQGFQVSPENLLVCLEGRLELLQRLGEVLARHPLFFGLDHPRPGNMVDYLWQNKAKNQVITATSILNIVLEDLGDIWPGRSTISGINLGDVWPHSLLKTDCLGHEYIPFHKLSQWLTYSLLEHLQELGLKIIGLENLTGLAEYRNGGLFIDMRLIQIKNNLILQQQHLPASEIVVEWRALTISLLDKIATAIQEKLDLTASELPLVKVLQGGTWTAGRKIVKELRKDGATPIKIKSDGTVF